MTWAVRDFMQDLGGTEEVRGPGTSTHGAPTKPPGRMAVPPVLRLPGTPTLPHTLRLQLRRGRAGGPRPGRGRHPRRSP